MNKGIHTVIIGISASIDREHFLLNSHFFSPSVHLAMTSCNDVIAIFLFGVLLGIAFSTGNLTQQLLQGPVGIVMGIFKFFSSPQIFSNVSNKKLLGIVFGSLCGFLIIKLPSEHSVGGRLLCLNTSEI
jgi:hypothetical protein